MGKYVPFIRDTYSISLQATTQLSWQDRGQQANSVLTHAVSHTVQLVLSL